MHRSTLRLPYPLRTNIPRSEVRLRARAKVPPLLGLLLAGLVAFASFSPRSALAQESTAELLARVSASVVQVRCGSDAWTGFVVDSRLVATALAPLNQSCEPSVLFASGSAQVARVKAWSEADGVALLELGVPSIAPPLASDEAPQVAGNPAICLGLDAGAGAGDRRPRVVPRFGFVSVVEGAHWAIDVRGATGDRGAPILSPSGKVIALVTEVRPESPVVDAARADRFVSLASQPSAPGKFTPHPHVVVGEFGGLFLALQESSGMQGAGIDGGFRRNSWALNVSEGFLRKDFVPIAPNVFEAHRRYLFELSTTFDWQVSRGSKLNFGPGVSLDFDATETRRVLSAQLLETHKVTRFHPRPLLVFEWTTSHLLLRMPVSLLEPAVRLDIGVIFNR